MTSFSWVPFFHKLTQHVLNYDERQGELLALLREMASADLPVVPTEDDQPGGGRAPLTEIDPFTFVATFARSGDDTTGRLCRWINERWNLGAEIPTDFAGLARVNPRGGGSWFFASAEGGRAAPRGADDIPLLWRVARAAFGSNANEFDADLYAECGRLPWCGIRKLTIGLYWFSPNGFLPLGGNVLPFLKARGVKWDNQALHEYDINEYRRLVSAAHDVDYNHPSLVDKALKWEETHPEEAVAPLVELPATPLNTILYGPPGTGKTYNTINRALSIIDGEVPADREECMERFEELRDKGRIGFITFHQSFSYEEFVEGLRPVLEGDEGEARYAIRDGVFKRFALRALGASLELAVVAPPGKPAFESIWNAFVSATEDEPDRTYPGLSPEAVYKFEVTDRGTVKAHNIVSGSRYRCTGARIEEVWRHFPYLDKIDTSHARRVIPQGEQHHVIAAVVNELNRIAAASDLIGNIVPAPHNDIDRAHKFLEGSSDFHIRPNAESLPHVLIIDEINRGNISKIFGELITLLEDDKRLGKKNRLMVELPYSREPFGVPSNLYLLGTMNTADKSLALLDVALRRRFTFEEMRPNFKICWPHDNPMRRVLEELNRRIMQLLDREHCIGHAFFIGATEENFNAIFGTRIVPLLQEYFYNDWEGMRAALGESGAGSIVCDIPAIDGVRARNKYGWWHDVDGSQPDFLAVLAKNYGFTSAAAPTELPAE